MKNYLKYKGMIIHHNHDGSTCTIHSTYTVPIRYGSSTSLSVNTGDVAIMLNRYHYLSNLSIPDLINTLMMNWNRLPSDSGALELLTVLFLLREMHGNNFYAHLSSLSLSPTVIRGILIYNLPYIVIPNDSLINGAVYNLLNNHNLNFNHQQTEDNNNIAQEIIEEDDLNLEQITFENSDERSNSNQEQTIIERNLPNLINYIILTNDRENNIYTIPLDNTNSEETISENNYNLAQVTVNLILISNGVDSIISINYGMSNIIYYPISTRYNDARTGIVTFTTHIDTIFNNHRYSDNMHIQQSVGMLIANQLDSSPETSNLFSSLLLLQNHIRDNFSSASEIHLTFIKAMLTQYIRYITNTIDNDRTSNHNLEFPIDHVIPTLGWSTTNIAITINIELFDIRYHYTINLSANRLIGILLSDQQNLHSAPMSNLLNDLFLIRNPTHNDFSSLFQMPITIHRFPNLEYIVNSEQSPDNEEDDSVIDRIIAPREDDQENLYNTEQNQDFDENDNSSLEQENSNIVIEQIISVNNNNRNNGENNNDQTILEDTENEEEWISIENNNAWTYVNNNAPEQNDNGWIVPTTDNNNILLETDNEASDDNQTDSVSNNDVIGLSNTLDFFVVDANSF